MLRRVQTDASVYASYSANIYDDETGLYDSGMEHGATSYTGGDSVNISYTPPWGYTTYAIATYWDLCYQIPGEYDGEGGCTWSTSEGGPLWGQWVTMQVASPAPPSTPVYSYTITPPAGTSGYSSNGNLASYTDSVMGSWSFGTSGYDSLNRLVSGSATSGPYQGLQVSWSYDSFGNRTGEIFGGSSGASLPTSTTPQYNANNQVTGGSLGYDSAGNVTYDNANQYLYDGEGRICAVRDMTFGGMTGYLYNASGQRVGKGTITSLSCDLTQNGFSLTNQYILGPNGEQMTENTYSGGSPTWQHTNAYAGGAIATYKNDSISPHFRFTDWLGTTRAQTDNIGNLELTCQSLPFGDPSMPQCSAPPKTEQFFTGQERDQESGNDYFQARYYANSMGRFLSPDPSGLDLADPGNPQSLNLYSYALNDPLTLVDPTGLRWECTIVTPVYPTDPNNPDSGGTRGTPTTNCNWVPDTVNLNQFDYTDLSLFQPMVNMGYLTTGQSNTASNTAAKPAPKTFWQKNWDCVSNVGEPVLEHDLNPFSLGIGTVAEATSQMSQASLQAAATWSLKRGLTVPLRSSVVRAGVGSAEALGRLSLAATLLNVNYALDDAIYAEHTGCKF